MTLSESFKGNLDARKTVYADGRVSFYNKSKITMTFSILETGVDGN